MMRVKIAKITKQLLEGAALLKRISCIVSVYEVDTTEVNFARTYDTVFFYPKVMNYLQI